MNSGESSSDEDEQMRKNVELFRIIREKTSQEKIIKKLKRKLDDGADINATNKRCKTILDIARHKKYDDVEKFLQGLVENNNTETDARTSVEEPLHQNNPNSLVLDHGNSEKSSQRQENFHYTGGLRKSLHGNIYQLKLQMLFLKRALDKGYEFSLGTEVEDAEKFDDIVFKYKRKDSNEQPGIRFVQAKHKLDESIKITANDLFNTKEGDFSLQKYFISYRKIKKSAFNDPPNEFKYFTICTNIDFDYNEKFTSSSNEQGVRKKNKETRKQIKLLNIKEEEKGHALYYNGKKIDEYDDILGVNVQGKTSAFYKLDKPKVLYEKLRETSDLYMLVKELGKILDRQLSNQRKLELRSDIFKRYHVPLSTKVLNIKNQKSKFCVDFVEGNNLSEAVANFRNVFKSVLKLDDNHFKQRLREINLDVSKNFGQVFILPSDTTILNSEDLAKKLAEIIKDAVVKRLPVIKINRNSHIIKNNIDKLAGHMLVQDEEQEELSKFRKVFFNFNNSLDPNLEMFRYNLKEALEKYKIDFNDLEEYKFTINDFITCEETSEGELLYNKDDLPNDKVEDKEIEEFFEKLIFAVNQPNETQLGEIITKELGKSNQFNLLDASLVSDSFQTIMLDWFKDKNGIWLNAESGKQFMKSIEDKISGLITVGIGVAYSEELASYGISFYKNNLFEELNAFLSKECMKLIFYIVALEETILSAIKIYEALKFMKRYNSHDSYIFIRLSTLLRPKTQERIMTALKSKMNYHFLIIDVDCKSDNIQQLHEKLARVNKKIIFIIRETDLFLKYLQVTDKVHIVKDNCTFGDLNKGSKKQLLEKDVTFQGHPICLKKLYFKSKDGKHQLTDGELNQLEIDTKTIIKLIKGDVIKVGPRLEDLGEVTDYYVNRRLKQTSFSKQQIQQYFQDISSELFVISDDTVSEFEDNNNIYVLNEMNSEIKFRELCKQDLKCNIHWLKSADSKKLIWYKSHGSIENLTKSRIMETYNSETDHLIVEDKLVVDNHHDRIEEDKLVKDNHKKIFIISDTAGMGKSTILTSLAIKLKEDFSLWVLRINLNDYTKELKKELDGRKSSKFNDKNKIIEFLINDLLRSKLKTDLEKNLFINCLNNIGKIAFLFDGFDEISPDYKDIVIGLLQSLNAFNIEKLFIATRPAMCEELERALNVFSYVLEPLSKSEQIDFFTKFWSKEFKNEKKIPRLKIYAKFIIERLSKSINDKERQFIGIPLQTRMIAEVFQENQKEIPLIWQSCKEFLESEDIEPKLSQNFDLIELYENFVKKKFYKFHYEEKKGIDFTKTGLPEAFDEKFQFFKTNHEILAMNSLFTEKDLENLQSQDEIKKFETLKEDIKNGKHNIGIVDMIMDDKPYFIHRTFAEYFASFALATKILAAPAKTLKCIENLMLNTSPIFINNIIVQLDGKQETIASALKHPLLHYIISTQKHLNFIKNLLKNGYNDWEKKLDSLNKTPLHYAIEYNYSKFVKILLDLADDIYEKNILKHGNFKKPEYENSNLVKFINIQDKSKKTALKYAIEKNNLDCAFDLLLKGASIDLLIDEDVNKLIKLMLYKKKSNLYDSHILSVYANQNNKYRPIQEKLLLRQPNEFRDLWIKDQSRILSYFFVHGRIKVIEALIGTIEDLQVRIKILNNDENGSTPLDRVNVSDQLSDDDCLKITEYLIENEGKLTKMHVGFSREIDEISGSESYITKILQGAVRYGRINTFKKFINKLHTGCLLHFRQAIDYNQKGIMLYLLKEHSDCVVVDKNTVLHTALDQKGDLKIIKTILIHENKIINARNSKGETPLFMAIYARSGLNVIKYLVNKGAVVNSEDNDHKTPLSYAIESNQGDIINFLIKKGAHISEDAEQLVNDFTQYDSNPFEAYFPKEFIDYFNKNRANRSEIILRNHQLVYDQFLFYKNPTEYDLNLVEAENGFPRLHNAIKSGNSEWSQFLIRQGANINMLDKQGKTPLHWASKCEQLKIVELLLQYGAIFDKKDNNNNTPCDLIRGISRRSINYDKIVWLLDALNILFSSNQLLRDLLKYQAEGSGELDQTENINPFIIDNLSMEYSKLLTESWKEWKSPLLYFLNARNTEEKTLLHIAAAIHEEDEEAISDLLWFNDKFISEKEQKNKRYENYQSISIDVVDSQGNTPLHIAAQNGYDEVVSLLLQKGAIFDSENNQGETPEILAKNNNHTKVIYLFQLIKDRFIAIEKNNLESLTEEKIQKCINAKNQYGKTALHLAASFDMEIKQFLDNGAKIEAVDFDENTSLHIAAKNDKMNNVILLLQYGAIYNPQNTQKMTPLNMACGRSYELLKEIDDLFENIQSDDPKMNIIKLNTIHKNYELDIRNIVNIRDNYGNTLLHYAAEFSELGIIKLLIENGAEYNIVNKRKSTPCEMSTNPSIQNFFYNIDEMFENVENIFEYHETIGEKTITNVRNRYGEGILDSVFDVNTSDKWNLIIEFLNEKGAQIPSEIIKAVKKKSKKRKRREGKKNGSGRNLCPHDELPIRIHFI